MDPDDLCSGPFFRLRLSRTADRAELTRLFPGASPGEVTKAGMSATLKGAHLVEDLVVTNPACETMLRRLLTVTVGRTTGLDAAADRGDW
ncbi:hypothetical protein ACFVTF_28745 [Kitasatospora sp. NPDC057940]|uniref:hypothetical protein n=1 Tax=Kitasatospora sp. NPDC057940 TaxID=3346285 RepID=UPI0036D9071C